MREQVDRANLSSSVSLSFTFLFTSLCRKLNFDAIMRGIGKHLLNFFSFFFASVKRQSSGEKPQAGYRFDFFQTSFGTTYTKYRRINPTSETYKYRHRFSRSSVIHDRELNDNDGFVTRVMREILPARFRKFPNDSRRIALRNGRFHAVLTHLYNMYDNVNVRQICSTL